MTVDELIAKNVEARGGMEAMKAIGSALITGKMMMGGGMEAPFEIRFKRPGKVRLEFQIQGMTGIQAYDGETGWAVMPFMGKTEPEVMADDQLKDIKDQSDFDGALVDYRDKGHEIEYLGIEEVEGTEAHKLKITKADGDVEYSFLDTEYYLEFRKEGEREMQGNMIKVTSAIGDYKEVAGVLIAHSVESEIGDSGNTHTIAIEKIEVNVEIADEIFTMPTVEKKEAAEEASE